MATSKPAVSAPAPWDNPGVPPTEAAQLAAQQAAQEQADAAAALAASTVPPGAGAQAPQTADAASGGAVTANTPVEVASDVYVTVTARKAFVLNWTHDIRFEYKSGIQEMPLAHAEHWWAIANGVEIYKR